MFHHATDASKVCLVHLAAALIASGFELLDAQFVTAHLATLGAVEISRDDYPRRLAPAVQRTAVFPARRTDLLSGSMALQILDEARAGHFPAGSWPPNSVE
jgi:leucyl/phenylalanyl-tRNA--protein transferase